MNGLLNMFKVLLALLICLSFSAAQAATISIAGSSTVKRYMDLAAKVYAQLHPDIVFDITAGGSTHGLGKALDQSVDIGTMSRALSDAEKSALKDVEVIAIAYDAVAAIVSEDIFNAGVKSIALDDLTKIYRHEITNWQALGGPNRAIMVVDDTIYHGTRYVFAKRVLGSDIAPHPQGAVVLDGSEDMMHLVQASDQAIAYVGMAFVNSQVRSLALSVDGHDVDLTAENIRQDRYPLARKLYLLVPLSASKEAREFIKFITSKEGQSLVEKVGYLPI